MATPIFVVQGLWIDEDSHRGGYVDLDTAATHGWAWHLANKRCDEEHRQGWQSWEDYRVVGRHGAAKPVEEVVWDDDLDDAIPF